LQKESVIARLDEKLKECNTYLPDNLKQSRNDYLQFVCNLLRYEDDFFDQYINYNID